MRKEAVVTGSLLRPLPDAEKAEIARWLLARAWPVLGTVIRPQIALRLPLAQAEAHAALERGDRRKDPAGRAVAPPGPSAAGRPANAIPVKSAIPCHPRHPHHPRHSRLD